MEEDDVRMVRHYAFRQSLSGGEQSDIRERPETGCIEWWLRRIVGMPCTSFLRFVGRSWTLEFGYYNRNLPKNYPGSMDHYLWHIGAYFIVLFDGQRVMSQDEFWAANPVTPRRASRFQTMLEREGPRVVEVRIQADASATILLESGHSIHILGNGANDEVTWSLDESWSIQDIFEDRTRHMSGFEMISGATVADLRQLRIALDDVEADEGSASDSGDRI